METGFITDKINTPLIKGVGGLGSRTYFNAYIIYLILAKIAKISQKQ